MLSHFPLLEISGNNSFLECHFWGNGVAAITQDLIIMVAEVSGDVFQMSHVLIRICFHRD